MPSAVATQSHVFTKRHYQRIANELAIMRPQSASERASELLNIPNFTPPTPYNRGLRDGYWDNWTLIVEHFCDLFAQDNSKFDRDSFLFWCYAKKGGSDARSSGT